MKLFSGVLIAALGLAAAGHCQTVIYGGRSIRGSWDATNASSTNPSRSGAGSPSGRDSCAKAGETYFQTDATPGQNLWACTASGTPGTWTPIGGGGGTVNLLGSYGFFTPWGTPSVGSPDYQAYSGGANRVGVYALPPLAGNLKFSTLAFYLGGTPLGSGNGVAFGVYSFNGSTWTKLAQSSVFTYNWTTQWTNVSFSPAVTLTPGTLYALAVYSDSTTFTLQTAGFSMSYAGLGMNVATKYWGYWDGSTCTTKVSGNGGSIVLPSGCGAINSGFFGPPDVILLP